MDARDGFAEEGRDAEDADLLVALVLGERDRVGDDELLDEVATADLLDGAVGEDRVHAGGSDTAGAMLAGNARRGDDGAAGEDLVIGDDDIAAFDLAFAAVGLWLVGRCRPTPSPVPRAASPVKAPAPARA